MSKTIRLAGSIEDLPESDPRHGYRPDVRITLVWHMDQTFAVVDDPSNTDCPVVERIPPTQDACDWLAGYYFDQPWGQRTCAPHPWSAPDHDPKIRVVDVWVGHTDLTSPKWVRYIRPGMFEFTSADERDEVAGRLVERIADYRTGDGQERDAAVDEVAGMTDDEIHELSIGHEEE